MDDRGRAHTARKFGLRADHVERTVDELSPGERTRAGLALLQARGTNVLVLDEPTNHLDLPAIRQLEQALETYDGALLLVTHDRRMLQNVRLDRSWLVRGGRITSCSGGQMPGGRRDVAASATAIAGVPACRNDAARSCSRRRTAF